MYNLTETEHENGTCIFLRENFLCRKWRNSKISADVAEDVIQIVMPKCLRLSLLQVAHDIPASSHSGVTKPFARLSQSFYWPKMKQSIKWYCKICETCDKVGKSHKPANAPLQSLPIMDEPCERFSFDIISNVPRCAGGYRFLLIAVDHSTHFPFAIALKKQEAQDVTNALIAIFTQFSFPKEILCDNAPQFHSKWHNIF